MKRLPMFLAYLGLMASAVLLSCTGHGPVAGGEIGNPTVAMTGTALYSDGKPAGGARVLLRKADFLAEDRGSKLLSSTASPAQYKVAAAGAATNISYTNVSLANVFTDADGKFTIDSVDPGDYRIEINDGQHQAVLIDCEVKALRDTNLSSHTLAQTGSVHGVVKWDTPPQSPYLTLVYGVDRVTLVDQGTGEFTIDDLPPGTYTFKTGCLGTGCLSKDLENITVTAGQATKLDTLTLSSFAAEDYSQWAKSATLKINTGAAGANVGDTLLGFPLLVRLDSSNFDFSQADGRGRDIRFAGAAGQHLPYDVERWDSLERKAEIWVRMDTVYGGTDGQPLKLYWGKPNAAFYTGGAQVFSAAAGFRGVWHLGEEGSSTPNGFRDVTGHGNHGTGQNMSPAASENAVVGRGVQFDGNSSIAVNPDSSLHSGTALTVEAWINYATNAKFTRLISKATASTGVPWTEYDIETDGTASKLTFNITSGGTLHTALSATSPALNTWYHVVGTYDGATLRIYVNGVDEGDLPLVGVITDYGRGLSFGKYEFDDASNFRGLLDEVRVSGVVRSPGWIKLSYENQRSGSKLISF